MIVPEEIKLITAKNELVVVFAGQKSVLNAEFLRVLSPSAEVRGHGVGEDILQVGKKNVQILGIEMVGQYALKVSFDDGHDTGLYTWDYLHQLATEQDELWQIYLHKLALVGASREP